jgi:hypothetical protein
MIDKNSAANRKPTRMRRLMNTIKPWKTVSVIPLSSGWSNRYRRADGRIIIDPCPGLVIQERGGESRVAFATYHEGLVFPAVETAGYEESSTAGGPRSNPYRAGLPPWLLLDEVDPVAKAAAEAASGVKLATSFVLPGT